MKEHRYTKGRLNLPFVGICTFGKSPYIENWDDIKADVAINFSIPNSAVNNITIALESSIPVICGTTGWLDHYKKITQIAIQNKTAFLYASNFSIGVNLFFKLNKTLAKIVQNHSEYKASLEEIHHIHKLDAPSGTAITLAEEIIENSNLKQWCKQDARAVSYTHLTLPTICSV